MDTSTAILLGLDTWSSDSETEEKTGGLEEDGKAEMQTEEPDVEGSWTQEKTALEHLKSRMENFTRWTEDCPDLFSLEEASHELVPTMASLVIFTVSGHQFVLHCPTSQEQQFMVEVSVESGLSTWAVALNEYLQRQNQVDLSHVLEKAAQLLSNHTQDCSSLSASSLSASSRISSPSHDSKCVANMEDFGNIVDLNTETKEDSQPRIGKEKVVKLGKEQRLLVRAREVSKKLEKQKKKNTRSYAQKIKKIGTQFHCRVCMFRTKIKLRAKIHSYHNCFAKKSSAVMKKSVPCGLCPEIFTSSIVKNQHHVKVHEKALPCSKCPGKFWKTHRTWTQHLSEVHGPKKGSLSCPLCTYKTARKANMNRHNRNLHVMAPQHQKTVSAGSASSSSSTSAERPTPVIQYLGEGCLLLYAGDKKVHLLKKPGSSCKQVLRKISTVTIPFVAKNIKTSTSRSHIAFLSESGMQCVIYLAGGEVQMMVEVPEELTPGDPYSFTWLPDSLMFMLHTSTSLHLLEINRSTISHISSLSMKCHNLVDITFIQQQEEFMMMMMLTQQGQVVIGHIKGGSIEITRRQKQVFEASPPTSIFYSHQLGALLTSSSSELKVDFKSNRGTMESICVQESSSPSPGASNPGSSPGQETLRGASPLNSSLSLSLDHASLMRRDAPLSPLTLDFPVDELKAESDTESDTEEEDILEESVKKESDVDVEEEEKSKEEERSRDWADQVEEEERFSDVEEVMEELIAQIRIVKALDEDANKDMEREISERKKVIKLLSQGKKVHDDLYKEAEIMAIAYSNFGHKVKNVAAKLAEQREGASRLCGDTT